MNGKKLLSTLKNKILLLFSHSGFRRYFFNTSWLFAEKILRMTIGLFVSVWVARYLGPERFGLLSYAQAFVGLFTAISTLGLDGILVRELVKDENEKDKLLGTAFFLRLFGAISVLIILIIAINFTSNDKYTNILIFIIASATVFQSFNVIDMYFQAKVLSKYVVYANIFSLFISSLVKIFLILNKAPLIAFALVVVFDSFVLACGYVFWYLKYGNPLKYWKFDRRLALSLLRDSWPLTLSGIAISLYMRIDQAIIGNMLGMKEVGYYNVAIKFSELWLFVTVTITKSLFPAIVNAKNKSQKKYLERIENLYRLLVFISLTISVLIFFLAKPLVLYTYGFGYEKSIILLQLYIWSIIFVFLNNGSWQWYIVENLQHIAIIRLFVGAFINIILNIYWIKLYGLKGAVYATLVSYAIATYFGNLFSKKTIINFQMQTKAILTFYNLKGVN